MYTCVLEWVEEGGSGGGGGTTTRTALCPSLVSSAGNVQTSRGRQKQLDHDLSSGALRQIKGRRLMRGDQGNLSSCSKSCFSAPCCARTPGQMVPLLVTDHSNDTWFSCYTKRKSNPSHSAREEKGKTEHSTHTALNYGTSCFHFKAAQLPEGNSDGKTPHEQASRKRSQWSRIRLITLNVCCSPLSIIVHLRRDQHKYT